ncbi:hypothetical protein [Tuwongella immobilis]|uniref:Uncharacterized protein n=1 Tax=Tuwongella immobilis TaxID=692036 RepID=A0A6C2YV29_9BACT|nr:hypothetical protein [Tuwongella immobilis]VIP05023.1 Uncharacterized protein OS=Singulisphaera acidiphila (strain ATCC BAA-1392 / DSM 18658 / VKM B-2454 / MOB10) GN=Sinac_6921 PE=4 SV=1 [Tuwongella immobilis]VTS07404.1 Uncharacterized protein OS=Singulisphaera acidiphila (strain ATCC BAA-1392 / DSM 18658 / VKM B-2454 / MOB10) GN=Sinac_6921 PE=4 SV=1 [Tuwongella immobilis]
MSDPIPQKPIRPSNEEIAQAMAEQPVEPLLPAEKWLIGGSLTLGIVLLALLGWLTKTYFPIPT